MKRNLAYLGYVLRHKLYVLQGGLATGASIWRLLIHDWSKFLPSEWKPYSTKYYNEDGTSRYIPRKKRDQLYDESEVLENFYEAFKLHYKRNKHHWHYWVYFKGIHGKDLDAMQMPDKYVAEMLADWYGTGKAKGRKGGWGEVREWYKQNKDSMILHPTTQIYVEARLRVGGAI